MKYGGVSVLSYHIIYPFMVPLSYHIHVCIYIHIMYPIKHIVYTHVPHQACTYLPVPVPVPAQPQRYHFALSTCQALSRFTNLLAVNIGINGIDVNKHWHV